MIQITKNTLSLKLSTVCLAEPIRQLSELSHHNAVLLSRTDLSSLLSGRGAKVLFLNIPGPDSAYLLV